MRGARRYFDERLKDPQFKAFYDEAKEELDRITHSFVPDNEGHQDAQT